MATRWTGTLGRMSGQLLFVGPPNVHPVFTFGFDLSLLLYLSFGSQGFLFMTGDMPSLVWRPLQGSRAKKQKKLPNCLCFAHKPSFSVSPTEAPPPNMPFTMTQDEVHSMLAVYPGFQSLKYVTNKPSGGPVGWRLRMATGELRRSWMTIRFRGSFALPSFLISKSLFSHPFRLGQKPCCCLLSQGVWLRARAAGEWRVPWLRVRLLRRRGQRDVREGPARAERDSRRPYDWLACIHLTPM